MSIILYESKCIDPAYNLALEQYLFETKKKGDILILLWQNEDTVVVGRYQNTWEEVDTKFAKANNIKVVRRTTGGGAVFHDIGNLNYSFIVDDRSDLDDLMDLLIDVLTEVGVNCRFEGRNDILVDGAKFSGMASYESGGRILYHGTILVNSDLGKLGRVLTRKNKVTDSRSIKSKPKKVINLTDIDDTITVRRILDGFRDHTTSEPIILTLKDITTNDHIISLVEERYGNDEWNCGSNMNYSYRDVRPLNNGNVIIEFDVNKNVINKCRITGDFISNVNINAVEDSIIGRQFAEELVDEIVKKI